MSKLSDHITFKLIESISDDPHLVSFPQGLPSETITDLGASAEELNLVIGEKRSGKRKKQQILSSINGVSYKGINYDDYSSNSNTCKYLIGVLNPGESVMTLSSADHIFSMKPELISKVAIPRNSTMSAYDRRTSLTEEFGSKKKKRAMQAAQSNIILAENISGLTAVENAISEQYDDLDAETALLNAADEALELNRQALLPKYDTSAATPEEAYPISDLIPNDVIRSLEEFIEARMETYKESFVSTLEKYLMADCSQIILSFMNKAPKPTEKVLAESGEDSKPIKKYRKALLRICVLHIFLKFYKCMESKGLRNIKRSDLQTQINTSEKILFYLVDNFSITKKIAGKFNYSVTKSNLDKLLMHIIVLGLHLSDFNLDMNTLSKDLKLAPNVVCNIARELGCKIDKSVETIGEDKETVYKASLMVPLTFPKRKLKRGGSKPY